MDEKNLHGSIFKKLREEREYKLKDIAGDVISTRTLMRFEADETSISIATFEKLLENLNINHLDYLTFYYDNIDTETTDFANRLQKLLQSGSSSKLVNECKKELKKKGLEMMMLSTATKNWKAIMHFYIDEIGMNFWSAKLYKRL